MAQEDRKTDNVSSFTEEGEGNLDITQSDAKKVLPELGVTQTYVDDYFKTIRGQLGDDYINRVMQLAGSTEVFKIKLKKPSGEKEYDPATDKEEIVYLDGEYEERDYTRRKITPIEIDQIERARAAYVTCTDPAQITYLMAKFYEIVAYKYLRLKHEDYNRCAWEDTRLILDACTFRTVYSLPYAPKRSTI